MTKSLPVLQVGFLGDVKCKDSLNETEAAVPCSKRAAAIPVYVTTR